jgi:6-phosphogluconolactonase
MKLRREFLLGLVTIAATAPTLLASSVNATEGASRIGTLYTMTNATSGNQILAFEQMPNGKLRPSSVISTNGKGSGGGLGNQGGLALSPDRRWLFAVNAGSNEISIFKFNGNQPQLVNKVSSGGVRPVSLTIQGDLLYVVNAGSDDVVGFKLGNKGEIWQLPNSRRQLSNTGTAPAQIRFSPNGRTIVVTEKATNIISTFPVKYGYLGNRISNPSVANTPFGFAFDRRGHLIVSEAVGGTPNASSVSSYRLFNNSQLQAITPAAKTNQTAACWIVISRNGEYAYTSNTASGSITGFKIGRDGSLKVLNEDGRTGVTGNGSGPIDMIISRNGRFLSSLNTGNGTISTFQIAENGTLATVDTTSSLPTSANGLVAR